MASIPAICDSLQNLQLAKNWYLSQSSSFTTYFIYKRCRAIANIENISDHNTSIQLFFAGMIALILGMGIHKTRYLLQLKYFKSIYDCYP